jgi:hypothetical protein
MPSSWNEVSLSRGPLLLRRERTLRRNRFPIERKEEGLKKRNLITNKCQEITDTNNTKSSSWLFFMWKISVWISA